MVTSKGSYVYGELKNVLPSSVQKTHLPVRGRKIARYMGGGMGSRMEKCKISCTPIPWYRVCTKAMVTSKGSYVYGELKNVLPSSVQKTHLPVRGRKIARYMGGGMGWWLKKMQNFVHPNHHGTVFALKQWLHQREATCMESSKMYCPRRCRKPTYPCGAEK